MIGIYKIVNKITGKVYIGQSVNVFHRTGTHRSNLNANKNNENKHLQSAWNKYGEENFSLIPIIQLKEELRKDINKLKEELCFWEQFFQDQYHSNDPKFGYNTRKAAKSNFGHKASPETIEKLRQLSSGKNNSMYGKMAWNKGLTKETDKRVAIGSTKAGNSNRGKKWSEEQKKRVRGFKSGHTPWNKNKKNCYSEEIIKSLSEFNKNKHPSEETKRKLSMVGIGNKYALGHKQSEKHKKLISEKLKNYWKNKKENGQSSSTTP